MVVVMMVSLVGEQLLNQLAPNTKPQSSSAATLSTRIGESTTPLTLRTEGVPE